MSKADSPPPAVSLVTRTLVIGDRSVSVRLDDAHWDAFDDLCRREGQSGDAIASRIDSLRGKKPLAKAIHQYVIRYFKDAADRDPPSSPGMSEDDGEQPTLSPTLRDALDRIKPKAED
jgi:predicted DNA-binding ribbon-helix-helix protein